MFQHFQRNIRQKNRFLSLQHSRNARNAQGLGPNLDRWSVRISIERQNLQTFSVAAQNQEVGSMKGTSVGQNATEAVQEGFYRGPIGHSGGQVQQSAISISISRYHVRIQMLITVRC